MPRKPLPPEQRRSEKIEFYVTPPWMASAAKLAKKKGFESLPEYFRDCINRVQFADSGKKGEYRPEEKKPAKAPAAKAPAGKSLGKAKKASKVSKT